MPYPRRPSLVGVRAVLLLCCLALATPAYADTLELPTPEAARVQRDDLIKIVGGKPDRLLKSDVPGPVVNDESVRVGVGGDGSVVTVTADQRLRVEGEGDYAIRERGPARSATSLSADPPPVTRRGAVVWQGFSPGRRDLAARLTLDPLIEAPHLPLTVTVSWTGTDGTTAALRDGGHIPGAGTVTVAVTNATSQPQVLPTAADGDPRVLAPLLDKALAVARRPNAGRLPSTDLGLPATIEATAAAREQASQAVPLRLRGSLRLSGTTGGVQGPATTPTADGATFAGTLGGSAPQNAGASVAFTVKADGPGQLLLDLTAVGALNPAELAPPNGFATWARWAAASPPLAERKNALDLLVAVAATGARASSYSPYLGADLVGTGSTSFAYAFAPPAARTVARPELSARWGAISLVGVAALLLLVNGGLIWRRS
jgi:hypothetical protein